MSNPLRLVYARPAHQPAHDDESHAASPPARRWKVVRRDYQLVLGRYASKQKAYSAATRFSADGCTYDVVEDAAPVRKQTRLASTPDVPNAPN